MSTFKTLLLFTLFIILPAHLSAQTMSIPVINYLLSDSTQTVDARALLAGKTFYIVGQGVNDTSNIWEGETVFNDQLSEMIYTELRGPQAGTQRSYNITVQENKVIFNIDNAYTVIGEKKDDYILAIGYNNAGTAMDNLRFYFDKEKADAYFENLMPTIGSIQSLAGNKTLALESMYDNNRTNIYVGDVIVTDENTTASVLLNNNTLIKLGVHTFLKITEYVFDDEIAVSPNPHIAKPVPFNFIVEGTIEIIDNYIEMVEEPLQKASTAMLETRSLSNTKEKTVGTFETRSMTYEEYKINKTISDAVDADKIKVIYENRDKNVLIVKVPSMSYQEDGGIYSTVKRMFMDKNISSPSCTGTTRSGSSGVRGTAFIHSSGTCSEAPAAYVKEGAIDIALNDTDRPLTLEEGEVTRDFMDKENADQELKNGLNEELYQSQPYILKWHTDNCVLSGDGTKARCYYDDDHHIVRQDEGHYADTDYYYFDFYNRAHDWEMNGNLIQSPLDRSEISAKRRTNKKEYNGMFRIYGEGSSEYVVDTYDDNDTLRSRSVVKCATFDPSKVHTAVGFYNMKYEAYWDADGNVILNDNGSGIHNMLHYLDPSMCPTYEQIDAIYNFDWSQSKLYQMKMTGSE